MAIIVMATTTTTGIGRRKSKIRIERDSVTFFFFLKKILIPIDKYIYSAPIDTYLLVESS